MEKIGIADFKALIKRSLADPGLFASKTIVLWNASYMQYGIAYRTIEQCCEEHNMNSDQKVWFEYSDYAFKTDDIPNIKAYHDGLKTSGILFNTGCFMKTELDDWLKFVNTHENDKGCLSKDWVLIVCAQASSYDLDEKQFSDNCDIYDLQPSIEEWAEWAAQFYSPEVLNPIRAFIESRTPSVRFDDWQRIMQSLEKRMSPMPADDRMAELLPPARKIEKLKQVSEKDFSLAVLGSIPGFPYYTELWDFVQSYES